MSEWANTPEPGDIPEWVKSLPPKMVEGAPNPAYFQARLERLNLAAENSLASGSELPGGFAQLQKGILHEAKLLGLSEKDVLDNRSEASKIDDAITKIVDAPGEVFALAEAEADGIERAMRKAVEVTLGIIEKRQVNGQIGRVHGTRKVRASDPKGKVQILQKWIKLLEKVKLLRKMATEDLPVPATHPNEKLAWRASTVLRFAAYVQRSNIKAYQTDNPADACLKFGPHHGSIALDMHLVENGIELVGNGKTAPANYDGLMVVMAPGHGKTDMGVAWATRRICRKPTSCGMIVHAQAPKAKEILGYIKSNFKRDNINGRRCMALYPLQLSDVDDNSAKMRLKLNVVIKSPTVEAVGVLAKVSGSSVDWILFDDVVDQEIADQPESRRRVFDRINGTFLRRLRGSGTMHLTLCTLWHYDDPNARRMTLARQKKIHTKVLIRRCGGPDSKPAFKPLWPEVYGEAYLRKTFNEMKNPALYAAQYQCDPRPESLRVIRKLRLYDPTDNEHKAFLNSAVRHLTIDPSATEHEKSDRAAMLYAAHGSRKVEEPMPDGGTAVKMESQLRFLSGSQFLANQSNLVEAAAEFMAGKPVDYVHVEVRSAFQAVSEMFKNQYNLDVVRHDPLSASKGQRLKAAAPMLEDNNAVQGIRATVLFPGVPDGRGGLTIDPSLAWLEQQILQFGATAEDHGVDAMTQLVNYLASDLGVGAGLATMQVREAQREVSMFKSRLQQLWNTQPKSDDDRENEYLANRFQ